MNDISSLYVITFLFRVLDNLKDYTVKALVNAVDHLGTVASKLTDLFDQQNSDISTMELRASCVSQVTKLSHTSLFIGLTFSRQPPLRFVYVLFVSNCLHAGLISTKKVLDSNSY